MHQTGKSSYDGVYSVINDLSFRDTLYAARMARDLLWEDYRAINLDEFVVVSQT